MDPAEEWEEEETETAGAKATLSAGPVKGVWPLRGIKELILLLGKVRVLLRLVLHVGNRWEKGSWERNEERPDVIVRWLVTTGHVLRDLPRKYTTECGKVATFYCIHAEEIFCDSRNSDKTHPRQPI